MISVELIEESGSKVFEMEACGSLGEALLEAGAAFVMPCGGMGRCGKCRVRFKSGVPEASDAEKRLLSKEEIDDGIRLLCRCRPETDCELEIVGNAKDDIVAETAENGEVVTSEKNGCAVAIDIGTTTIAAALVNEDGRIVSTASCVNRQRRYGTDVISRIAAAEDTEVAAEMKRLAWEDIAGLIRELTSDVHSCSTGDTADAGCECEINDIIIAGNTTMLHLLTGKNVAGLGVYPYTPVSLKMEEFDASDCSAETILCRKKTVTLLPGISAFVGADIVAGLFYVMNKKSDDACILYIDLGTNGEMALIEGDSIKAASTAAGPVFEAGGISCGVASVPGAITHVGITSPCEEDLTTSGYAVRYTTIGDKPPIGLCGTGVMELVSEMVRCGIIDETGLLAEEFFDRGFPVTEDGSIRLTQQDIRNVQMGKAAIAAGIRALTEGQTPDAIYIAGGFGSHIDIEKIKYLKMLPSEFAGRTIAVGNASLKGAAMFAVRRLSKRICAQEADFIASDTTEMRRQSDVDETQIACDAGSDLKAIVRRTTVLQLAETQDFDETYLDSMAF